MKKTLLLLGISLLFSVSSFAQVKISGGILGGVNLATISMDPTPANMDLSNLTGFGAGGVLNFAFSEGFGIKAEPMYLQTGTKVTSGGLEAKLKVNYINVPVMFTYTFGTGSNQLQPYIMAGPSLGIKLNATSVDPNGNETDYKDNIKSTNFVATFGAGINIAAGKNVIFLEGRYSLGLSNVNNISSDPTTVKTKEIQVFGGIMFPFGS